MATPLPGDVRPSESPGPSHERNGAGLGSLLRVVQGLDAGVILQAFLAQKGRFGALMAQVEQRFGVSGGFGEATVGAASGAGSVPAPVDKKTRRGRFAGQSA